MGKKSDEEYEGKPKFVLMCAMRKARPGLYVPIILKANVGIWLHDALIKMSGLKGVFDHCSELWSTHTTCATKVGVIGLGQGMLGGDI